MVLFRRSVVVVAMLWSALAAGTTEAAPSGTPAPGAGQTKAAPADEEDDAPTPAPLTVGSMAIASVSDLAVEAMAVDVSLDRVTYNYRLRNKGSSKLDLAASVAMPDLEVNNDANVAYALPAETPENPVNLSVKSNDAPIATTSAVQATALGLDRLADLKAAHLPLIPFGTATDEALAAAKPDVLTHLESLGLVTPRDASQPDTPLIADWSLRVVQGWTQPLAPNAVTNVSVGFAPIKAIYRVDAGTVTGLNALKDQVCLTAPIIAGVRAMLKNKDATADVADIALANDGPARWLDNPAATVAVRKPQPNSLIAFCGMDAASANKPVVTGTMPGSDQATGLRVLIFTPAPANK